MFTEQEIILNRTPTEKNIPGHERFPKGKKIGKLEVLETYDYKKYNRKILVKCDCGNIKKVSYTSMISQHQRSCGECSSKKEQKKWGRGFYATFNEG